MSNELATRRGEETTMNKPWNHGARGSKNRWRWLSLVAVLALGLVGPGASSASAAAPAVPFKASVSGTVSPTAPLTFVLAGTGTSSDLGKVKTYGANVVITSGDPVNGPMTNTLTETLTGANGDTLTILCQQIASSISPGVFRGVDQWTVIGGTGRFSGATGSGTGNTYVDLNVGTFAKEATGTITY